MGVGGYMATQCFMLFLSKIYQVSVEGYGCLGFPQSPRSRLHNVWSWRTGGHRCTRCLAGLVFVLGVSWSVLRWEGVSVSSRPS